MYGSWKIGSKVVGQGSRAMLVNGTWKHLQLNITLKWKIKPKWEGISAILLLEFHGRGVGKNKKGQKLKEIFKLSLIWRTFIGGGGTHYIEQFKHEVWYQRCQLNKWIWGKGTYFHMSLTCSVTLWLLTYLCLISVPKVASHPVLYNACGSLV